MDHSSNNLASSGESLVSAMAEADLRTERSSALCACAACSTVVRYGALKLLPFWDPLRGDPRFEKIVASPAPKKP